MNSKAFLFSPTPLNANLAIWILGLILAFPISNSIDYYPWQNCFPPNFNIVNYQDRQYALRLVALASLNLIVPVAIKAIEVLYDGVIRSRTTHAGNPFTHSFTKSNVTAFSIVIIKSVGVALAISMLFCFSERYYAGINQPDLRLIMIFGPSLMGDFGMVSYILFYSSFWSYSLIEEIIAKYFPNLLNNKWSHWISLFVFGVFHAINIIALFIAINFVVGIDGESEAITNKIFWATTALVVVVVIYVFLYDKYSKKDASWVKSVFKTAAIFIFSVVSLAFATYFGLIPWYVFVN